METKTVYISLPISGYDLAERKSYAKEVKSVVEHLKQFKGWVVFTPFDVCPDAEHMEYAEAMGIDLMTVLESDAVVLCEGWEKSLGCLDEAFVAHNHRKMIFTLSGLKDAEADVALILSSKCIY